MNTEQLAGHNDDYVIHHLWLTGHFWNPACPDCHNVKFDDLAHLKITDKVVQQAVRSMSLFDASAYAGFVLEDHGRQPMFDGQVGTSIRRLASEPRCWVPDFPAVHEDRIVVSAGDDMEDVMLSQMPVPATGVGNWKGCHDIGDFHSAIVNVKQDGIDVRLSPVFKEVLRNVQHAYDQVGLRFIFVSDGIDMLTGETVSERSNIEFSFVSRSSGWIGLAIIGQNQVCQSNIWCKYLLTYRPANMANEWTTLIKHELGHNTGRGHTTGGVMNPSIVRGLPLDWPTTDPSYNWFTRQFGGEPVPTDDTPPIPQPPQPDSIEKRLDRLEVASIDSRVRDAVHDATLDYLINRDN